MNMKNLTLLHMPESTDNSDCSNTQQKLHAPKLLKVVLPGYQVDTQSATRYPLSEKNSNFNEMNITQKVPQLLDLRKVSSNYNNSNKKPEKELPKLLKLPFLSKQQSQVNVIPNNVKNISIPLLPTKEKILKNKTHFVDISDENKSPITLATVIPNTNKHEVPVKINNEKKLDKTKQIVKDFSKITSTESLNQHIIKINSPRHERNFSPVPKDRSSSLKKLLESPKQEVSKQVTIKQPTAPILFDIRSTENQNNEMKQLISTDNQPKTSTKRASRRSASMQQKSKINSQKYEHGNFDESNTDSTFEFQKSKKKKKTNSDREEEIYNVIYDLFVKRKRHHRKKKRRELNLFDIIDNIPLTSESDSSPEVHIRKGKSKYHKHDVVDSVKNKSNDIQPAYNPYSQEIYSSIPDPIIKTSKPSSSRYDTSLSKQETIKNNRHGFNDIEMNGDVANLEKYKPKISKYLNPEHLLGNDPLSWLNIIRDARTETKDTQTDKTKELNPISVEVQTELKEMTEIPKTQTFFTTDNKQNESAKTKEFCDQVRKEIIEKLEPKVIVDNKGSQTISNATTQTDVINNLEDIKNYHAEDNNVKVKLPPDLYSKIHFSTTNDENKVNQFLNIVDIEEENSDKKKITENVSNILGTNEQVGKNKPETGFNITENLEFDKIKEIDNSTLQTDGLAVFNKTYQYSDKPDVRTDDGIDMIKSNFLPGKTFKISDTPQPQPKLARKSLDINRSQENVSSSRSRTLLGSHIDNFTAGLDAIEEIQQSIEQELKQSKFLFKTISTLQSGFTTQSTNDVGSETIQPYVDPDKYSVRKYNTTNRDVSRTTSDDFQETSNKRFDLDIISERNEKDENEYVLHFPSHSLDDELNFTEDNHTQEDTRKNLDNSNISNLENISEEYGNLSENHRNLLKNHRNLDHNKSYADRNLESLLQEVSPILRKEYLFDSYEKENNDDDDEQRQKDELYKDEIRQRISKPVQDPVLMQKQAKRRKLMKWMKEKRSERHEQYMKKLDEKRDQEFKPFVSKRTYTTKEIDHNTSIIEETKRVLLQENNEERIKMAERLADHVINQSKQSPRQQINKTSKRYQKPNSTTHDQKPSSIPVRETRTSRIRKRALVNQIISMKHNSKKNENTSKKKKQKKSTSSIRTQKNNRNKNDPMSLFISNRLEESLNVSRYVNADEFVTQGTLENYLTKSQVFLQDSLRSYSRVDESEKAFPGGKTRVITQNHKKEISSPSKRISSNVVANRYNDQGKSGYLRRPVNEDDSHLRASDTIQLLEEVDRLLMTNDGNDVTNVGKNYYDDDPLVGASVDWNEVDRILNASD